MHGSKEFFDDYLRRAAFSPNKEQLFKDLAVAVAAFGISVFDEADVSGWRTVATNIYFDCQALEDTRLDDLIDSSDCISVITTWMAD